jgi:uncharacterized SAM-binding protein YcdF (DUF218 family)
MLITDEYHMPRTRRLFALNGIETVPVIAPMPTTLHVGDQVNKIMIIVVVQIMNATIRDILFGSSDCREIP